MDYKKAPEEVKQAFADALPDDPIVERKLMFGYPAMYVNGNMVGGVHEDNIVVRLPDGPRTEALALDGASPLIAMGRTMKEYVVLPKAMHADRDTLSGWLARAIAYGATLPAKEAKPRKTKAK
jgi:TfoX/Sxy family transcriptional regulator of competence genes